MGKKKKRQRKNEFALFELEHLSSCTSVFHTLRLGAGLIALVPWFSDLWTWTGTTLPAFWGVQLVHSKILGLDSLHNHMNQSLIINLF